MQSRICYGLSTAVVKKRKNLELDLRDLLPLVLSLLLKR